MYVEIYCSTWIICCLGSEGAFLITIVVPQIPLSVRIPLLGLPKNFKPNFKAKMHQLAVVPHAPVRDNMGGVTKVPQMKAVPTVKQPELDTKGAEPYPHLTLWCRDDTGADMLKLNTFDLDAISQAAVRPDNPDFTPEAPLLGWAVMRTATDEAHWGQIRLVEVNMFDEDGNPMSEQWDMIDCSVFAPDQTGTDIKRPVRLGGPWLRHRLYTATVPDGTDRLWVGTNGTSWIHQAHPRIGSSGMLWRYPYLRSRLPRGGVTGGPGCNIFNLG